MLLVDWNPNSMPVVDKRMPAITDYILTIWTLVAAICLVLLKDYGQRLSDLQTSFFTYFGISVLITVPWWIWRSNKAIAYYIQHKPLTRVHLLSLYLTNIVAYGFALFVFWEIPAWLHGERLWGFAVFLIALLLPPYFFKKR